jgi:integrase
MRGSVVETFEGSGVWRLKAYGGRRISAKTGKSIPIQIRETVHGSRRAADKAMTALQAKVDSTRATTTDTVGDLLDKWEAACTAREYSPNTLRNYRRIIKNDLRPALGKIKLRNLTAQHLDVLYSGMTAKGSKPATVARVHALICGALSQAMKWYLVPTNVAHLATVPKIEKTEIVVPTREEMVEIVRTADELNPLLGTLVYLAAHTGMRRGELCALRWEDIDLDEAVIHVSHSVFDGGQTHEGIGIKSTKSGKSRDVLLGDACVRRLRVHHERCIADQEGEPLGYVFSSAMGHAPVSLQVVTKFVTKVGKLTGVPIHTHTLRHFSATQALGQYDIATVADRLGHANPAITAAIYSHATSERARGLADYLDIDETPALTG